MGYFGCKTDGAFIIVVSFWVLFSCYLYSVNDSVAKSPGSIDEILLSNRTSEKAHEYKISGKIWGGKSNQSLQWSIERREYPIVRYDGYEEFTVNSTPQTELVIKKLVETNVPNQTVEVVVDGRAVGLWRQRPRFGGYDKGFDEIQYTIPGERVSGNKTRIRLNHVGLSPYVSSAGYYRTHQVNTPATAYLSKITNLGLLLFAIWYLVTRSIRQKKHTGKRLAVTTKDFAAAMAVILIVSSVIFSWVFIHKMPGGKFIDEDYWLYNTFFYYLYSNGDVINKEWFGIQGYEQPPVGKYILGFMLEETNKKQVTNIGGLTRWYCSIYNNNFNYPLEDRVSRGNLAKDRILLDFVDKTYNCSAMTVAEPVELKQEDYIAGRTVSLLFGILAIVVLASILTIYFNDFRAGLFASVMLLMSDIIVDIFITVLVDSICLFFSLMSLAILIAIFDRLKRRMGPGNGRILWPDKLTVLLGVAEGVTIALAVGTKPITAYVVFLVWGVFLAGMLSSAIHLRSDFARMKTAIASQCALLIVINMTFIISFIGVNPFLSSHPVDNTVYWLDFRKTVQEVHPAIFPGKMMSFPHKIGEIYVHGAVKASSVKSQSDLSAIANILCIMIGMWFVLDGAIDEHRRAKFIGPYTIILLWFMSTFAVNGWGISMADWWRYYIPFIACSAFAKGLGISRLLGVVDAYASEIASKHSGK